MKTIYYPDGELSGRYIPERTLKIYLVTAGFNSSFFLLSVSFREKLL